MWSHVNKARRIALFRRRRSASLPPSYEPDAQKVETSLRESTDGNDPITLIHIHTHITHTPHTHVHTHHIYTRAHTHVHTTGQQTE